MKGNKGFTLVELLVMMVVIGVLMSVAVPNITGILNNNRANVLKSDAILMVDKAKLLFSTRKDLKRPEKGKCLVLTLNYLDDNDDITTGPNHGTYNINESFVLVQRVNNSYVYYVRLIEDIKSGKSKYGINFENAMKLGDKDNSFIKGAKGLTNLGMTGNSDSDKAKLNTLTSGMCSAGIQIVNSES